MAEEKRKTILIASILKPVDDTRMYEKFAVSLASLNRYNIHVIGYPSNAIVNHDRITFHSLQRFKRIGVQRLFARLSALKIVFSVRPSLIIVTTHELLGVGLAARIWLGAKLLYDVQENYFRNIFFGKTMPKWFAIIVAPVVRLKEIVSSIFISHFILAEKCYARELKFTGKKFTVIENKVRRPVTPVSPRESRTRLLFSGTIAESTGVFKAIQLASELHALDNRISLTIVGHSPQQITLERVREMIRDKRFITLMGGEQVVQHQQIIQQIRAADFGLILYEVNRATAERIPTKLYEYIGYKLPIIIIDHKPWTKMVLQHHAGIVIEKEADLEKLIKKMEEDQFYPSPPTDVFWEEDERHLTDLIKSILG
jgi:hypothetical protein